MSIKNNIIQFSLQHTSIQENKSTICICTMVFYLCFIFTQCYFHSLEVWGISELNIIVAQFLELFPWKFFKFTFWRLFVLNLVIPLIQSATWMFWRVWLPYVLSFVWYVYKAQIFEVNTIWGLIFINTAFSVFNAN